MKDKRIRALLLMKMVVKWRMLITDKLEQFISRVKIKLQLATEKYTKKYNVALLELIKDMLQERKNTWCTLCYKLIAEDQVTLFLKCIKKDTEIATIALHSFSDVKIHRACPHCSNDAHRDGFSLTSNFSIFNVEQRYDGYYYRTELRGKWIKLENNEWSELYEWSDDLIDKLTKELRLPPKIPKQTNKQTS